MNVLFFVHTRLGDLFFCESSFLCFLGVKFFVLSLLGL